MKHLCRTLQTLQTLCRPNAKCQALNAVSYPAQRPDANIQLSCEMQQWSILWKPNTSGSRHAIHLDFSFRVLQWPLPVMDFSAVHAPRVPRVEAVALGQPMLQAALVSRLNRPDGAIASPKFRARLIAAGFVGDPFAADLRRHASVKVRQTIESAGRPHGGKVRSVQAEEVNTGLAVERDIGADIQLRKAREPRQRRKAARVNAAHVKRDDSNPAATVKGIQGQVGRYERAKNMRREGPVGKQQIMPGLRHDPRTRVQGPGTVGNRFEELLH